MRFSTFIKFTGNVSLIPEFLLQTTLTTINFVGGGVQFLTRYPHQSQQANSEVPCEQNK